MRESRPYGSVRGARDETRVPTATPARVHIAAWRRGRCLAARGTRRLLDCVPCTPPGEWHQRIQWCAETLLAHSDTRSPDAEWLRSPRLRMPTIRLLLLITGNLRTLSVSMCRIALARSSSSRQQ